MFAVVEWKKLMLCFVLLFKGKALIRLLGVAGVVRMGCLVVRRSLVEDRIKDARMCRLL